jgi:hypothetical protein
MINLLTLDIFFVLVMKFPTKFRPHTLPVVEDFGEVIVVVTWGKQSQLPVFYFNWDWEFDKTHFY